MHYTVTYHGLHKWYEAMFEKLGWMLLAKRDGYNTKLKSYKEGVMNLKEALEEKLASTRDQDRKEDIRLLHKNTLTLLKHLEKDFRSIKAHAHVFPK